MNWLAFATSKWTWIAMAGVALLSASTYALVEFGNKRYNEGVMAERQVWNKVIEEARTDARESRAQLARAIAEADAESARLTAQRNQALAQVQEDIQNATDVETQYRVYRAHHDRLRNQTRTDLARARESYLSSLGSSGNSSAGSVGSGDVGPDDTGSGDVHFVSRGMVGYCFG